MIRVTNSKEFSRILSKYAPLVARVAATYEADAMHRQDLIQDISLALWRALETFRGDASLKTFIAKVAHNRAVDHVLKETRRHDRLQCDESLHEVLSSGHNDTQDKALDLMTAMRRLNVRYRQVIALQLEGFTHGEIAQTLGLSEAAVSQRAHRARHELETIMGQK